MCFRKCSRVSEWSCIPWWLNTKLKCLLLSLESQLGVWCWARSLVERWKLCTRNLMCTALPVGALNPAGRQETTIGVAQKPTWPFWSTQCKEITLSRVWIHRIWKGTVSTVRFDFFFLHVSNHRTQCFLARLGIGCQGNPAKQKISPGGRDEAGDSQEEMGGGIN